MKQKKEYTPLKDEKMGDMLLKNFNAFIALLNEMEEDRDEGEEEKTEDKVKEPDYSLYRKLSSEYGKKTDKILYQLISRVFYDCDETKIQTYLPQYLHLVFINKCLKDQFIPDGISMVIAAMPELCLEVPQVDKFVVEYVIKPLWDDEAL